MKIKGEYLNDRNAFIMQSEPMILHCHHYNVFLQKSIEASNEYIDAEGILTDSAQEVSYSIFSDYFKQGDFSVSEKLKTIESLHSCCGFGTLEMSNVTADGGNVNSPSNHYVEGWLSKFGARKEDESGAAFFTAGFIAGAMDAAFEKELGYYCSKQTHCKTKKDLTNSFEITIINKKGLKESPKEGAFQTFEMQNNNESNIDYLGVRTALTSMDFDGDSEDGLISVFGVMLTRMFANYYVLISSKFLFEMDAKMGEMGSIIATELLIEAGHVCAFNTFGGIMESAEWNGLIKPMIQTKEDWVHGIVACLNSLGWGGLFIKELIPNEKLVLEVVSGYESNSFLKNHNENETNKPMSLFKTGAVAGIMNLIYHGDISENPELNEEYYTKIFKSEGKFTGKQIQCRLNGFESDLFVAERE